MTRAEVIAKVRKLYALARSTTPGEAQAAIAAAEKICQAHRLSEAEIDAPDSVAAQIARGELCRTPREVWRLVMLGFFAKRYSCAFYDDGTNIRVFGGDSDIALLRLQYMRVTDAIHHVSLRGCSGKGRSVLDAFRKGMVASIIDRLGAERRDPAASTALMRLDVRTAAADAEMRKQVPGLATRRVQAKPIRADGYYAGREAGRRLHLGESIGSGVRGELKS